MDDKEKNCPIEENTTSDRNTPGGDDRQVMPGTPSSTPLYVRVLALLGALVFLGLTIAYAYSIATGGIFWM